MINTSKFSGPFSMKNALAPLLEGSTTFFILNKDITIECLGCGVA